MASVLGWASAALVLVGAFFFLAGTVGLLRFPDVYNRLHALTKADNVGLGFVVLGLILQAGSLLSAFKILLIWLLVLASGATAAHLVATAALRGGIKPWKHR
ncbi:MAG: monovalent cation/H(+) antiporter subunit G [Rubrobacter sp.]|nr:monovalent cation/H(+) antiporter subunit G [Rubrobacter sp.]